MINKPPSQTWVKVDHYISTVVFAIIGAIVGVVLWYSMYGEFIDDNGQVYVWLWAQIHAAFERYTMIGAIVGGIIGWKRVG